MNKTKIAVVDHGVGNLQSVLNALSYANHNVELVQTPKDVESSGVVVLPGVGNFGAVMSAISSLGILDAISNRLASDRPFLGICVGMQVLFESSTESPGVKGFGSFRGSLEHLSSLGHESPTPSIGWHTLKYTNHSANAPTLNEAYFVHSYFASGIDKNDLVASYMWNNQEIPSYVSKGNVHGVQFHPEKSRIEGVKFLNGLLTDIQQ